MSDAQTQAPGLPRRGRPRREVARKRPASGEPIKPTASGQLEPAENDELNRLTADTGRTRSYVVRAAILLLLREQRRNGLDWSKPLEHAAFVKCG